MDEIRTSFKIAYEEICMDSFLKRYHFEEKDRMLLDAVCRFLTEVVEVEAGILLKDEQAVCIVTLGKRYDELSNLIVDAGHLLLSYSLECFGMELLSRAYKRIDEMVLEKVGKQLGEYKFLGDKELENMEEGLFEIHNIPVHWENGMLHPLKSVIFTASYRKEGEKAGCNSCEQCENITCSFRKVVERKNKLYENVDNRKRSAKAYSYGASMIFGGEKE
ncbi:MAG: hypothetical protein PUC12_16840 [Clostridiales bacterium]|nr:hypothetical protein [Clostridiales bacterium]